MNDLEFMLISAEMAGYLRGLLKSKFLLELHKVEIRTILAEYDALRHARDAQSA